MEFSGKTTVACVFGLLRSLITPITITAAANLHAIKMKATSSDIEVVTRTTKSPSVSNIARIDDLNRELDSLRGMKSCHLPFEMSNS